MCLKPKLSQIKQAITDVKKEHNFLCYEIVRQLGRYNMLSDSARALTGLTEDEYRYVIKSYERLKFKFPDTTDKASNIIQQIKSANIVKIIKQKGCNNCIELVNTKLDITENDLCESCKNIVTS